MGRQRVSVNVPSMIPVDDIIAHGVRGEPDVGAVASLDETKSKLTILVWNFHDVAEGYEDERAVKLTIRGLRGDGQPRAREYSIDEHSGNAYTAWLAMGSPQPPSAEQIGKLHAASKMYPVDRDTARTATGDLALDLVLPRQSVKLIELEIARGTR
jgi:xylan 1,4-beta-xylosidase